MRFDNCPGVSILVGICFLTLAIRSASAALSFLRAPGRLCTGIFLILAASRFRIALFWAFTSLIRFVRTALYCFFAWANPVRFAFLVFFSRVARINASILLARAPTPALVLVTGTDTCCVGAIVVGPPLSRTRSMILSRFGERFRGFAAGAATGAGAGRLGAGRLALGDGGSRGSCGNRFLPRTETARGTVLVSFGPGTPSMGAVSRFRFFVTATLDGGGLGGSLPGAAVSKLVGLARRFRGLLGGWVAADGLEGGGGGGGAPDAVAGSCSFAALNSLA